VSHLLLTPERAKVLPPIRQDESLLTYLVRLIGVNAWREVYGGMSALDKLVLNHIWPINRRQSQAMPEGRWATWLVLGGRGLGKTRVGSETVNAWAMELGKKYGSAGHIALVAKDPADARGVMVEGESGILATAPPWFRPHYEPSKRKLTWPNGVHAHTYSSETPDQLRGPQHHKLWGDELCKWKRAQDTWDMAQFGLRRGTDPQALITTTPRPIPTLKLILSDPSTVITRGSMLENRDNLPERFINAILTKYGGTRLGRQEIDAELLEDTPGALWTLARIEASRVRPEDVPELEALVVAVDPAVTDPKRKPELADHIAETGIVVVGRGIDKHGYVLHDVSGQMSPNEWGTKAVVTYETLRAGVIVGEVNNGGDLVRNLVETCGKQQGYGVNFKSVTASRGKQTRAEPIAALYEQGRMHHVGAFPDLEDQMSTWVPGQKSPDRMDALVWGATECMLSQPDALIVR
jgi:phage terminase large subunit-like protein